MIQCRCQRFETSEIDRVVGVQDEDVLGPRALKEQITRPRELKIYGVPKQLATAKPSRVRSHPANHSLRGVIPRAVIGHDQVQMDSSLKANRLQAFDNVLLVVVQRDDDGDLGRGIWGFMMKKHLGRRLPAWGVIFG